MGALISRYEQNAVASAKQPAQRESGPVSDAGEVARLRARLGELETENTRLKRSSTGRAGGRARAALAAVLLVLSVLIAPAAVVGTWVRAELVETDKFVATLAPLADQAEVQTFVADEVVGAIEESLDIESVVHDAVAGLSSLDLPPQAATAFGMLEGPAVHGIQSILRTTVDRLVASPQFAQIWEATLREAHSSAIAVIQGDPDATLQLAGDGTLSIEVGPVIAEVKDRLVSQGVGLAGLIPAIDRSIPLVTSDSLTAARAGYSVATAVGYWLPWLAVGLLVAGIAVARNRTRATLAASLGLAASFLLLLAGLGTGRLFFVATMSPAFMPQATAESLFAHVTLSVHAVVVALVVLSGVIAVAAWLFGRSKQATAIRAAANRGFARARAGLDRLHLDTGRFGVWVDRLRPAIWCVAVAITVLAVFVNRPVTFGGVLGALAALAAALVGVELLRRPRAIVADNPGATQQIS